MLLASSKREREMQHRLKMHGNSVDITQVWLKFKIIMNINKSKLLRNGMHNIIIPRINETYKKRVERKSRGN